MAGPEKYQRVCLNTVPVKYTECSFILFFNLKFLGLFASTDNLEFKTAHKDKSVKN